MTENQITDFKKNQILDFKKNPITKTLSKSHNFLQIEKITNFNKSSKKNPKFRFHLQKNPKISKLQNIKMFSFLKVL